MKIETTTRNRKVLHLINENGRWIRLVFRHVEEAWASWMQNRRWATANDMLIELTENEDEGVWIDGALWKFSGKAQATPEQLADVALSEALQDFRGRGTYLSLYFTRHKKLFIYGFAKGLERLMSDIRYKDDESEDDITENLHEGEWFRPESSPHILAKPITV